MASREPNYRLEHNLYVFDLGAERQFDTEEVALLFDKSSNVLHKHGMPVYVERDYTRMRRAFKSIGADEMADDLFLIQGKFSVEDLNRVLTVSGQVGALYDKYFREVPRGCP